MTNPNNTDKDRLDALLRRTQAAQASHARTVLPPQKKIFGKGGAPANDATTVTAPDASPSAVIEELRETAADVRSGFKFVRDIKDVLVAGKQKVFDPVWDVIGPPIKFLTRGYGKLWKNYAYEEDKETGDKKINKTKAGILLAATFAAAVAATPTLPGEMVRYVTTEPVTDAVVMMVSMRHNETLYNVKSHNIDAAAGTYDVQGCHQPTNCNADLTKTFRLEERLSHTIWNTAVNGHPFFMTDRIAAAIPQGNNKCEFTSYSGRIPLLKYFHIFPKALDIKCTPMAGGEVIPTPGPALAP